ncbi:Group II intron-encoded protein LtrA (plasmid) [Klebsiella pneumoniae]|nr:Group II intron-encoded protein LtrA [Klebsiella pneumoniae]SXE76539.1 Retron-type reverse transcriptase [Klebsiella variicola]CAE7142681.1 Group II intron-encoded protein LtrA [Klebsiella pneumoniae]CAF3040964.1 Group II intron-encoded protein LtrA [Klebsiella pneumoniae]CAF3060219.1 Group II intron-encoded protein LtrA [Klebsiella pneumoniae]
MYGEEKSDSLIVAAKQANNPKGAESVERRSGAKGNAEQPHMRRTQRLSRVREAAKQRKKERFTALFHLLTVEALEAAFLSLSRKAAAGVDGIRWMDYAGNMKNNITDLHRRLHQGSYRAQPGRRHYIPKADGKQRPLGIASLEDKIVQYALVKILNAVYENDFMGFSYGFRPGRSQHDALDALATGLVRTNVNWVLDADISQFFDRVSHEWLIRFTEHRIGDRRVIRLIRKWLTAGTSEEGQWRATEEGTPQGAVISPLLANIYLHYVFDLWAHQWRRRYATGNVVMVRYADDIVIGFDKRYDAPALPYSHAAQTEGVRTHGSPGENPSDGVRPLRCRKPCHQGKRQTRNVQLPRVHAHQRERSQRQVHADTKDPPGSDDGNSESHQRRSAKALALLNPRTGKMAQESGSGIPELSLGTGQLPHHAEVQDTRNKPLAPGAQAQEPEG